MTTKLNNTQAELCGEDSLSKVVEEVWFAARHGEIDMRPYERRITAHAGKQLLDIIGPNEPVDGFSKDPNRSIRPAARNEVREELRAKMKEWAGGES